MIASLTYTKTTDLTLLVFLRVIIPASVCFALLNGGSNALNQATDWKEDCISKPYRPIPMGMISRKEAYLVSLFLYVIALFLSLTIHCLFALFVSLIAIFSITYSVPPRMKKILFLNQAWVALPRGFFGIIGSWSVFGNPFQPLPLVMGCIAALFLFGGTATKDILDADADRRVGTKTLVNVFGVKTTVLISLIFMFGAFLLMVPLMYYRVIEITFFPLIFLIILCGLIGWSMLYTHKNETCENTSAWALMYATYFLFALGFAVITIVFSS